ncbi:murein hydrolase activator EnvC family protein [Patescibacteria group bacterium]
MPQILKKKSIRRIISSGLVIALIFAFSMPASTRVDATSINDQIDQKSAESEHLESRIAELEGEIKIKKDQAASLRNQLGILEDNIKKQELEIDKKESDIEKTELEIKRTIANIEDAKREIDYQRTVLGEFIRTLDYSDDTSTVELILSDNSFSDILDNLQYIEALQGNVQNSLDTIKLLKSDLEFKKQELETKQANLEDQKKELELKVSQLEGTKQEKQNLLNQTEADEAKYQSLLGNARSDYNSKQSEIDNLEKRLRESMIHYGDPAPYASGWVWPVPAGTGVITCVFHCSNYFPGLVHTGLDIAASVGTPLYSATDGTVVHAGWSSTGGGYGLYAVVSSNNLLLIYGHMSSISVSTGQTVTAGTTLGGMGSTGFSTGSHVHFEVRKNGVPVDPLGFY